MDLRTRGWATSGISSMSIAAATAQHISTTNPTTKDPVSAWRYPNAYGPPKPATLASALIIPTATVAVDSSKISVGIAQNTGRNAMSTQIMLTSETVITLELGTVIRHNNPVAAKTSGAAACQHLSPVRSE